MGISTPTWLKLFQKDVLYIEQYFYYNSLPGGKRGQMVNNLINSPQKPGPYGDSIPPRQGWQENRQSEFIWLRLSGLVKGRQRLDCLEKALQINPRNKQALRLMERLNPKRASQVLRCLQEGGD
jgi:hypothetical protein